LILSKRSPLNAVYSNEAGQVLYKVETPLGFNTRVSSVYKVIPNTTNPPHVAKVELPLDGPEDQVKEKESKLEAESEEEEEEEDEKELGLTELSDTNLKDHFKLLGTIEHKLFGTSVWKDGGNTVELSQFLRREGFGPYGQYAFSKHQFICCR
jgi:hypothetical protein